MDARTGEEPPYLVEKQRKQAGSRFWRFVRFVFMVALPLIFIAGGIAGFGYLSATRPSVPVEVQGERPRAVNVTLAAPGPVQPTLLLYGQIVAGRSVEMRALVAGEIVSVSDALVEGGRIAAGEELLRIDPFAYEGAIIRARADLAETRARLDELEARIRQENVAIERAREQFEISTRENDRIEQLARSGTTTARALDESQLRLSQSLAALETRESQLAIFAAQRGQVEAALERLRIALSQAERNLADTVLRAPFDALVTSPAAERGRLVSANDRIATLIATGHIEARFALSDTQYGRLAATGELVGREVSVRWGAEAAGIETSARVARIAPQVSDGNFAAFATFAEGEETLDFLRPGAFIEVRMSDRVFEDALTVPPPALYENSVFVVEDGRLRRVPVEVLVFTADTVSIRADIPAGTPIVTSRMTAPATGQLVAIRAGGPPS